LDRHRPGRGGQPQAVVRLHVQAAVLQRRVPGHVQPVQRDPRGVADGDRRDHRGRDRRGGRALRGGLHRLCHRVRDRLRPRRDLRLRRDRSRRPVAAGVLLRRGQDLPRLLHARLPQLRGAGHDADRVLRQLRLHARPQVEALRPDHQAPAGQRPGHARADPRGPDRLGGGGATLQRTPDGLLGSLHPRLLQRPGRRVQGRVHGRLELLRNRLLEHDRGLVERREVRGADPRAGPRLRAGGLKVLGADRPVRTGVWRPHVAAVWSDGQTVATRGSSSGAAEREVRVDHADWEISGGRGRGSHRDRLGRRPRRAPGGGRRRRVPRGEIQRQSILDALERLLGEIPVMEISVKDITEAAGIKRPNFYFYFESKDEVLSELVSTVWREWDEAIGSYHRLAGESHADYFDRLFVVSHSVWVRRSRVIVAGLQATGYDRTLRAKWDALDDELNRQLAAQMDRDVAAGHRRQNRSAP